MYNNWVCFAFHMYFKMLVKCRSFQQYARNCWALLSLYYHRPQLEVVLTTCGVKRDLYACVYVCLLCCYYYYIAYIFPFSVACTTTIKALKPSILNLNLTQAAKACMWHTQYRSVGSPNPQAVGKSVSRLWHCIFRTTPNRHRIQWRVDSRGRKAPFAVMNIYNTPQPNTLIVQPVA